MSDLNDILEHHGIKGMHWGVRKSRSTGPQGVQVNSAATKKKIAAKGGENHPPHEDALKTAAAKQKAKASGTHALSNKDLKDAIERMNLEQNFNRLANGNNKSASSFIKAQLANVGKQQVSQLGNQFAAKQVATLLKKAAVG